MLEILWLLFFFSAFPSVKGSGKPWTPIGPHNIGDSITPDGGESGTLQPVVAAAGIQNLL